MKIARIGEILPGVQIPFWINENEEDDDIYVLGQNIAQMLNYSKSCGRLANVSKMIKLAKEEDVFKFKVNVDKEKEKYYKTHNIKFSNTIKNAVTREYWFVTLDGYYTIIANSDKPKAQELREAINSKDKCVYKKTRKEINFVNKLEKLINIKGKHQYSIDGYRIDYYIPELKIAIEYDENGHKGYSYAAHEGRQQYIENRLGCTFIRVSDEDDEEYNINYVIKNIYLYGKFPKKPMQIKYRKKQEA